MIAGISCSSKSHFIDEKGPSLPSWVKIPLGAYKLLGRVQMQWQEILMDCGIVLGVIAAATAFFSGSPYIAAGFAFMGLIALLGQNYVRKYPTLAHLKNLVGILSTHDKVLQQTTQRLGKIADDFQKENIQLKKTTEELTNTSNDLKATNSSLVGTNLKLESQVRLLEVSTDKIKSELVSFGKENMQFVESLKDLKLSKEGFQALYQSYQTTFVTNFDDLKKIHEANTLIQKETREHLKTQQEALNKEIEKFKLITGESGEFQQRLKQFETEVTRLSSENEKLAQNNLRFAETQKKLEETEKSIKEERKNVEITKQQIQLLMLQRPNVN